jgi:hypothetical protein
MQQPFMPNFVERFRKITENKTANLSCVGKIMERVIYKYVFNHLQRNKLFMNINLVFSQNIQQYTNYYKCITAF